MLGVTFNSTLFHVALAGTEPPRPSCILDRDVHLLSGMVTASCGGTVTVNVVNKTMPDYKLIFGPAIHDRGFIVHNVTAHLPCNTTAMTVVPGYAGCEDPSTGGKDVCNAIMFSEDPSPDVPAPNSSNKSLWSRTSWRRRWGARRRLCSAAVLPCAAVREARDRLVHRSRSPAA